MTLSAVVLRSQSDERLVALAASGSEPAFEAIVARYRRDLVAFCSRIQRSDVRGEDAVQQALLNAWTALRRGVEVRELKPWLYRITYNQAISALRRGGEDAAELPETLSGGESASEVQERRTLMRDTLSAVAALPDSQRRALIGTAVAGDSYEEVAVAMGISDTAIRGLVHRARVSVRAAVAAVSPAPLVAWAARGARRPAGVAGWVAETVGLGGASAGAASGVGSVSGAVSGAGVASGVAVKAAAVIASSAALAGGALVGTRPEAAHRAERTRASASAYGEARRVASTVRDPRPADATPAARPVGLVLRRSAITGSGRRPAPLASRTDGAANSARLGAGSGRRPVSGAGAGTGAGAGAAPIDHAAAARLDRGRSNSPVHTDRPMSEPGGGSRSISRAASGSGATNAATTGDSGAADSWGATGTTAPSDMGATDGANAPAATSTTPALTEATNDPASTAGSSGQPSEGPVASASSP